MRPVDLSTRLTRTSTFDLAAFDPSLGYKLALGGLDGFLEQEGTDALGALGVADGHDRVRRGPAVRRGAARSRTRSPGRPDSSW